MAENPASIDKDDLVEISAVSRLTGLSTHNLRVWESRHEVVQPVRSESGRRLYSRDDVRKLGLLKVLVDRGFKIGRLATLDIQQLEVRLAESEAASSTSAQMQESATNPQRRCHVAIAGHFVPSLFRHEGPLRDGFRVVSEHATFEELSESLRPSSADVVIIEEDTLFEPQIEAIQHLLTKVKARRAVLTYRFASEAALATIENQVVGITALRAPANATELRLACLAGMDLSPTDVPLEVEEPTSEAVDQETPDLRSTTEPPPRHFSPSELAAISEISSGIKCACPRHLASLVTSLLAFEKYSSQCENLNAEDAKLHTYLHRASAEARASMEKALMKVLDFEDIQIGG
jgi:DNA-binding transcriptional MerR regulator